MIITIDAKTWDRKFARRERPDVVYNSQYAIMSIRIRKSSAGKRHDNVVLMNNSIMPSIYVENAIDNIEYRKRYMEYLNEPTQLLDLCNYVETSLNYYPLIFIATPLEYNDLIYISVLSDFIQNKFECPVLEYKKYPNVITSKIQFGDNNQIQKKINSVRKKAIAERHFRDLQTYNGNQKILDRVKVADKKVLKRILKKHHLWEHNLSRLDMVERYMSFCIKDEPI